MIVERVLSIAGGFLVLVGQFVLGVITLPLWIAVSWNLGKDGNGRRDDV